MRTKEVAEICGVTEECIRQNAKKVGMDFGYGEFTNHDWTEDELRRIQMQLMRNSANSGTGSTIVKQQNQTSLELEGAYYYELMIFSERANFEATLREYAEKELQLKYMATVNLDTLDFPENAKVSAWFLISAKTNMCIMQDKQVLFVYVTPDDKVNALVYCYGD